jgi:thiamine kinase-like enzyme
LPGPQTPTKLFIIDWELSHVGSLAMDLGQMFAELFELKHFKHIDAGIWLIESFMEGYGSIDEKMAFKTAVHIGVHLITWGSSVQGWGTKDQIEDVVRIGRDFVVNGWKRDRAFFEEGVLRCLFR